MPSFGADRASRPPTVLRMLRACDARIGHRAVRLLATLLAGVVLLAAGAATAAGKAQAMTEGLVHLTVAVAPVPIALAAHAAPPAAHPTHRPRPPKPVRGKRVGPPVARWLPSGTGMWLHDYTKAEGGNARAVIARSKAAGLTTLYVQTGSSKKGFIGDQVLGKLLTESRGTAIRVVAWDFPTLADPVKDAKRLAAAAAYRCTGCPRVAAVAPDVETAAEGTRIGGAAVSLYYRTLRQHLPADVAILATVPWPSEKRVGTYPYAQTAALADGLMPMAYWYNRSPAGVTATSMAYLKRFHRPIMPIGQGYDGRIDAPYLPVDPHPGVGVEQFLDQAHRAGARAVSLWSWDTAGGQQWTVLSRGRGLFRR